MRVLLADDHGLMARGLRTILGAGGIEVVGLARDGSECVRQARRLRPDAILMDSRMSSRGVLMATRVIMSELPRVRVLIVTPTPTGHELVEAMMYPGTGFLLRSLEGRQLLDVLLRPTPGPVRALPYAIRLADDINCPPARMRAGGGYVVRSADSAVGLPDAASPGSEALSERQEEVLTLLAQGLSYGEVADRVSLTPRTVKYHTGEIMRKLHLRNRSQVVAYGGSRGLGAPGDIRVAEGSLPPCVPDGVCPFGH